MDVQEWLQEPDVPPSTIEKVSSDDSSEASMPVTPSQKKRPNLEPEKETVHPENETVRDSFLQDPLRLLREGIFGPRSCQQTGSDR